MDLLRNGKDIFISTLKFFKKYPVCIVPLLICWCIYAWVILYSEYYFDWNKYNWQINFGIAFLCYIIFSFMYGFACLFILELMQQAETTGRVRPTKAFFDALLRDFWKALPILFIWALIWFLLMLLSAVSSSKSDDEEEADEAFTARAAVGTLMGEGERISFSSAFLHVMSKIVRMVTFMILPIIAWEDDSPKKAYKKGLSILSDIKAEFAVAFGVTGVFTVILMFWPSILLSVDAKFHLNLPEPVWYAVLIYIAFAMSLSFLVEQLYMAELYLWYKEWKRENERRAAIGKKPIKLNKTTKPSFIDDIRSLNE